MMELLVTMAVFTIVVTIVSDVYLTTFGSQRRAFGQQSVLESSRFALEAMARSIRQSTVVSATETRLEINHPLKGTIVYEKSGQRILENSAPLTADNVSVNRLSFLTSGLAGNDGRQPRVTISLEVSSANQKLREQSRLNVQTTITPRRLQVE